MNKYSYAAIALVLAPAAAQAATSTIKCDMTQKAVDQTGNVTNRTSEAYYILDDDARTLRVFQPSTGVIAAPCDTSCNWLYSPTSITYSKTLTLRTLESQTDFELNRVTGALSRRFVMRDRRGLSISVHTGTCQAAPLPPVAPPKF